MTKIWIEDPGVFIRDKGYLNFAPRKNMSKVEQINALTLLLIYVYILLALLDFNVYIVNVAILSLIIIMVILYYGYYAKNIESKPLNNNVDIETGYYDSNNELHMGKFYSSKFPDKKLDRSYAEIQKYYENNQRMPTADNPMMNPLLVDFNTENIPVASNADDERIKDQIETMFNKDLFRDINDLFDVKNSQRIFYTVPGGAIPNDQQTFIEWCYKSPPTCHETTQSCFKNIWEDLRYRTSYR